MSERIWAPWRMEYIEKPQTGTDELNIFVDLPAQEDDRKNLILKRGQTTFVMLNAFPYTNGHLLVAPYRQTPDIEELNDEELLEVNQLLAKAVRWIKAAYRPDGFNIGINMGRAGGAGIPSHIHWHIVPRWNGDTNFMTTVGEVRVLPQTLEDSYDRLKQIADADA
ncbi:MAG TPA: HIT domain-containing protein [Fimbriimonadaceae bacterium]|nr:HIT domain-containing protein [Fimbriimonadaceae bacterium]